MVNIDSMEEPANAINIGVDAGPGNHYEEQYNANQDFAIFQPKDQTVGGIMSL